MPERREYDPRIPPGFPSREAFLLWNRGGRLTPSPFLKLLDYPGGKALADRLVEAGEVEIEFDVIGRELAKVGMFDEYGEMFFAALAAAVDQREKDAAPGV